jgi:hypothetical protein
MTQAELFERLSYLTDQTLIDNPYIAARALSSEVVEAELEKLSPNMAPAEMKMLFCISYSREVSAMAANSFQELKDAEVADRAEQFWETTLFPELGRKEPRQIRDQEDYPGAEWLDVPEEIGTVGDCPLYLLGHAYPELPNKKDYVLVAVDRGDDALSPIELYELQTHSQDPIVITGL